ncbi:MAG: tetraacyldisaccharide 4'-kinase [Pseudomonadota bacterium]
MACLLWPLSWVYAALVHLRAWGFRFGLLKSDRLPVPVIVVGNLIAGGAGKTPAVLALTDWLQRQGWRVGIVSRGHGRQEPGCAEVSANSRAIDVGDEPLLLHRRARVPVVVGRARAAAARRLLRAHPDVNLVLSDDGLQHRALHRDVQVLVFDERGAGNGWLLPAGPLREPMPRACPPNSLVLYNAAQASTPLPGHVGRRRLQGVVSWLDWQAGSPASSTALASLAQRSRRVSVWAAAGIAQPERFFDLLRQAGLHITPQPLADHHDFASGPPWPANVPEVVITEKDAVKLKVADLGTTQVWVAPLDFSPDASFFAALATLMQSLSLHPTPPCHGPPPA